MAGGAVKPFRVLVVGHTAELFTSLRDTTFGLPDIEKLDRRPSLKEAVEGFEDLAPNVILVEIPLTDGGHLSLLRRLGRSNPQLGIIAVAPREDAQLLLQAVFLGASALVRSDTPVEFLISTIRRVARGEKPIEYNVVASQGMASELVRFFGQPKVPLGISTLPSPLSQQQQKVLMAAAQGLTNREVANLLGLREQTVKNYMNTILKKVGARSRVQAVVYAMKNSWINLDEQLP